MSAPTDFPKQPRISYLIKLLAVLISLVVVLEAISYLATSVVVRNAVTQNAKRELVSGGDIFSRLIQNKAEQLALSVVVLTDDFGFKDAITSNDENTIRSALRNHAARVKADIGIFITQQGQIIFSQEMAQDNNIRQFDHLREQANQKGRAYETVVLDGKAYQFVVSVVRAPTPIGLAGMGFEIKPEFSDELKKLTNLDVSFLQWVNGEARYLAGTLDTVNRAQLRKNMHHQKAGDVFEYDQFMSLIVPVAGQDNELVAVLQIPLAKIFAPFSSLYLQLLLCALFFASVAGVFAWVLARSVTRPVSLLANIAKRIAQGFYNTPIKVKSNDELGDLAVAFISMQQAIAQREQEVNHQSEHDPVTGLPNRSRVFPELNAAISRADADSSNFSLFMVDLRNFAQINDELSQEIGDGILHLAGAVLVRYFGETGRVLRFGSDEFLCIVPSASHRFLAIAEAIHTLFKAPLVLGQIHLTLEVNIGIATYPQDANSAENLLRRTSLALNHGRLHARNTCTYEQGWDEQHLRRLHLVREFESSLRDRHIHLHYQPKISLVNPRTLGAEALVRWNHPQLGFIPPDEFIPVIESSGQITLLTRWVLREAIQQLHHMIEKNSAVSLSVNLSALDLLVDDLPDYISELLSFYAVPAAALCVEITESAIMREADKCLHNLKRLESLGVILSIDDFGTGYSSLSQLKKLPVSELKIDKSFILHLDDSEDDMLIVRSTIDLGHTMGLSVTAEGVETESIKTILQAYGCDTLQGYLYSRPLPAAEFMQWLTQYFSGVQSV